MPPKATIKLWKNKLIFHFRMAAELTGPPQNDDLELLSARNSILSSLPPTSGVGVSIIDYSYGLSVSEVCLPG